jgi:hypothetical protein
MSKIPIPRRAPWGQHLATFGKLRAGESVVVDSAAAKGMVLAARRTYGPGSVVQKKIGDNKYRVWRVR